MKSAYKETLRWDLKRQVWRRMNYICIDVSKTRPHTTYWVAKCSACGKEGLFHWGKGTCSDCSQGRRRAIISIASKAHAKVQAAIRKGLLPRLDGTVACVDCGCEAEVYDHREYARPLDVQPVCLACNNKRGP